LDFLLIIEAMSNYFREHHEAIMRWSWKLFCAKWVRLIQAADRQRQAAEKRRVEEEFERLRQAHAEAHGTG
jgi:hypothetical protein